MKTKYEDEVRDRVRQAYARAVTSTMSVEASPCACSPRSERKGSVSKFAGYDTKELAQMPEEAVVSSFGCGNPVAFSQIGAGQTVVDLGSGAGLDLFLAAQKVGPTGHVIGIDMTPEMIERAQANIAAAGIRNVEVRQGIIEDMPVESGTVDWVISNCVINLSPQKGKVFSEIHRVLRPGGRMLVSDVMVKELPEWVRSNQALYNSCIGGAISEEEYLNGLRLAGMSNVEVMARLVYDNSQMSGLIKSEIPEVKEVMSCCGPISAESIGAMAESIGAELQGKVWSATVYAEKPAS